VSHVSGLNSSYATAPDRRASLVSVNSGSACPTPPTPSRKRRPAYLDPPCWNEDDVGVGRAKPVPTRLIARSWPGGYPAAHHLLGHAAGRRCLGHPSARRHRPRRPSLAPSLLGTAPPARPRSRAWLQRTRSAPLVAAHIGGRLCPRPPVHSSLRPSAPCWMPSRGGCVRPPPSSTEEPRRWTAPAVLGTRRFRRDGRCSTLSRRAS